MVDVKLHLRLIRIVGVIMPRSMRPGWRKEWEVELRRREAKLDDRPKLNWIAGVVRIDAAAKEPIVSTSARPIR
jgi:hypothetical protein